MLFLKDRDVHLAKCNICESILWATDTAPEDVCYSCKKKVKRNKILVISLGIVAFIIWYSLCFYIGYLRGL
jgi:hypothetical protein